MLELILAVVMVITIGRIASADGQSTALWTGVALLAVVASFFIPLPFGRVLLAGIITFVAMVAYKVVKNQ